ncbi:DNA repair protein RecO [Marinilongibacter aquaticus]|uniref:DNA repair protein RecO n=1 Tax=Marinilongibacter aquaticus TaxID=2975157 RepID=UPI0021BD2602|nr:DNA repair protein RecO [Marinilongibacter aquaticus]UBM60547.1 DNA repair protein RecO [Marinilongibacter aquaticus]
MLHKTKGLVLHYLPYRETSIIVRIYTEKFGLQSYIENGVRSARGKNKIALFQPMSLLDLVVYHSEKKDLHRLSEVKCSAPLQSIPFDVRKSSISIFINEVLNKTLHEQSENEALFFFLYKSILTLDHQLEHFENFHLHFLAQYSGYLGFAPQNATEIETQFREFAVNIPIEEDTKLALNTLFKANFDTHMPISKHFRAHILEILVAFYRLHVEHFGDLKSLSVLKAVFS